MHMGEGRAQLFDCASVSGALIWQFIQNRPSGSGVNAGGVSLSAAGSVDRLSKNLFGTRVGTWDAKSPPQAQQKHSTQKVGLNRTVRRHNEKKLHTSQTLQFIVSVAKKIFVIYGVIIRVKKMVDINKERGDVGVWPWGSASPMDGDNIRLLTVRPSGIKVTGHRRTGAGKKLKLREADPRTQLPLAGKQLRIMGNHMSLETKTVLVTLQLILFINNQTVYDPEIWDQIEVKVWDSATKNDKAVVGLLSTWRAVSEALKSHV
ncbi:hypothetical protein Anapl_04998 [Anas platyrhynchos]|uniref:Uncharacterized protein n=1 Tax=Anas platyrhynchos TaxID=8839 RepID=R0K3P8_ANAPL|nr:hypothetical protein Anapl_04998 [Anas platyrhynchos]